MKFSERWLREWVDPPVDSATLIEQLTAAGLEVDSAAPVSGPLQKVVAARLVEVARHPDADRLSVCRVDAGQGALLEVVCGAPNARPGLCAPLALPGARLPAGVKVRKTKIRGQASSGMLCSANELGIGDEADGLLELMPDIEPGGSIAELLELDDVCIDVDLTPNRGDCLYLEGLARDVAAINGTRLVPRRVDPVPASDTRAFPVRLSAPESCPRYVGRVIGGVDAAARTPLWMVERLRRCGVRSLGPIVDVTNYVMLELGHPMHAFDLDRLQGAIDVRPAEAGERVRLLNDTEAELAPSDLVIADDRGAVALAGIMGGADTAVTGGTRSVFLECAWFEPRGIAATARRLALHTDASHRFERHVDPLGQIRATERATELLLSIVGGRAGPLEDHVERDALPASPRIRLRAARVERVLGVAVAADEVSRVLECLHMDLRSQPDGWQVVPPSFRPDVSIEEDLIEEVARIRGYASVPGRLPSAVLHMTPRPEGRRDLAALRRILVQRGYQEAVTYSFVDSALQSLMEDEVTPIALANPISSDMGVMRTSLMPGLLAAALHNLNRQHDRVRLFESGLSFRAENGRTLQQGRLAGIAVGPAEPAAWGRAPRPVDFFEVKADVEALFAARSDELEFVPARHPALHPGQCARVRLDGIECGVLGALHPELANTHKLAAPAVLFELALASLEAVPVPAFSPFSRQPTVRRDIAIVVDESVTVRAVREVVGQAGIDVLQNLELFDVYRGEGIDSGQKSLALALTFQDASRTLDDSRVEASVSRILDSLAKHLGATLRG